MRRSAGVTFLLVVGTVGILALVLRFGQKPEVSASNNQLGFAPAPVVSMPQPQALLPGSVQAEEAGPPAQLPELAVPTVIADTGPTQAPLAVPAAELQVPPAEPGIGSEEAPGAADWNPPAYQVPMALHPNDHYWMIRPVAANFRNSGLPYYPYGSNGPGNDLRVHHGIDISNPIGVEAMAAAPGLVIWADKGHSNEYETITTYGNTVVIQHDFSYRGQAVYTLYAHLAVILVKEGDRVEAGDVIGLIGNTGQVTGPHVHFEVRIGRDSYFAVQNPDLWMAPYLGTGVVAGQIEIGAGQPVYDADVELFSVAKGYVVQRTTTYAGNGVNSDERWGENFAFADVPAGKYTVRATFGDALWTGELEVVPGMTNWVDLELDPDGNAGQ